MTENISATARAAFQLCSSSKLTNCFAHVEAVSKSEGDSLRYTSTLMLLLAASRNQYAFLIKDYLDEDGFPPLTLPTIAWRTRNLLELYIWSLFCLKKKELANEFFEDKSRDMSDSLTSGGKLAEQLIQELNNTNHPAIGQLASLIETLPAIKKTLLEQSENLGITDLSDDYTRISEAAREIGKGVFFTGTNKLLSKFAHPTAFSILAAIPEKNSVELCISFVDIGAALFIELVDELAKYLTGANFKP